MSLGRRSLAEVSVASPPQMLLLPRGWRDLYPDLSEAHSFKLAWFSAAPIQVSIESVFIPQFWAFLSAWALFKLGIHSLPWYVAGI